MLYPRQFLTDYNITLCHKSVCPYSHSVKYVVYRKLLEMKHIDFWMCKFVLRQLLHFFRFQTFAVLWMLHSFFGVIPRCLNFMCRRFGTPCLFHLHRWYEQEEFFPLTPPTKKKQCSETSARKIQKPGNHQKKEYNFSIIRSCKGCIKI